jgi:hypothetical protein
VSLASLVGRACDGMCLVCCTHRGGRWWWVWPSDAALCCIAVGTGGIQQHILITYLLLPVCLLHTSMHTIGACGLSCDTAHTMTHMLPTTAAVMHPGDPPGTPHAPGPGVGRAAAPGGQAWGWLACAQVPGLMWRVCCSTPGLLSGLPGACAGDV